MKFDFFFSDFLLKKNCFDNAEVAFAHMRDKSLIKCDQN